MDEKSKAQGESKEYSIDVIETLKSKIPQRRAAKDEIMPSLQHDDYRLIGFRENQSDDQHSN